MSDIREPQKKSSIEKKRRIVEKGFELMCNKGFHNVTCVDIAKYANVSTGIIYQYFNDKREIFIEGAKDYSSSILFPIIDIIQNYNFNKFNLKDFVNTIIDDYINRHSHNKIAHETLIAMSHIDKEVSEILHEYEYKITESVSELLIKNGFNKDGLLIKIHIVINLIDNYCHEVVYHNHSEIDYKVMKDEVINIIIFVLGGNENEI